MGKIKVYKRKTVLVKWNWEKITVDIPYKTVEKAMSAETIKISPWHSIRTKAINEWYELNITDEIEAYIMDEYPDIQTQLLEEMKKRRKEGKRVSKVIVNNVAQRFMVKKSNG